MRYDDFRDCFERALSDAGLVPPRIFRTETIDTATTERSYEIVVGHERTQHAEPFHVTCTLSFRWNPFESARSFTTEEDLVTGLFGRDQMPAGTVPRYVRVDLRLNAGLPHGSKFRIPDAAVWRRWAPGNEARLATSLPHDVGGGEGGQLEVR